MITKQISYTNSKLLDIMGYTKEDLTGELTYDKIIPSKDFLRLIELPENMEIEFEINDKNGKRK